MLTLDSSTIAILGPLSTVCGAIAGALINKWWERRKFERKMALDSQQLLTKQEGSLREDLLNERTTMLQQMFQEKTLLFNQLMVERQQFGVELTELKKRVDMLEEQNRDKDRTILAQSGRIKDQESQLHAQEQQIKSLEARITTYNASPTATRI